MTPREVVTTMIEFNATRQPARAHALYTDDAPISHEMGLPAHTVDVGTSTWHNVQPRMYDNIEIQDLTVHETTDPEVVIAEWAYVAHIGDESVRTANVVVARVKDGKITSSRDYHDFVTRAVANGAVPQLLKTIESMTLTSDR